MLDANGRPVEVGDTVASPDLHIDRGKVREGTILGKVEEITIDAGLPIAHIGDGIVLSSWEMITLGGYEWHVCLSCNTPSPVDVRSEDEPTCPFCEGQRMEICHTLASPQAVAQLALL